MPQLIVLLSEIFTPARASCLSIFIVTLRVSRVQDADGNDLSFVQEDKNEDSDFAVIMPKPLDSRTNILPSQFNTTAMTHCAIQAVETSF